MDRAYSTLEIKALDEQKRTFRGVASTPSTDRMGDVVEPKGAKFKLPIPLLWQHDAGQPIGWVTAAKVTAAGIEVEGEIAQIQEEGQLKWRLRDAWQMIKAKLVRGLSIGFNPLESDRIDGTYGYRFLSWEWLELSAVTIPANQDASITTIKSIDAEVLAALGRGRSASPGASGNTKTPLLGKSYRGPKGNIMKTIKELRAERTEKNARLGELVELFKTEGHESTEDEAEEFDGLTSEVKQLDDQIRVMTFDAMNSAGAREIDGKSASAASRSRGPTIIVRGQDQEEKFKGQNYTRMVIAKALAHLNSVSPSVIAEHRWGKSNPTLIKLIKANEVAGGGSGSGEWGAELVSADNRYTGDFIEYLHEMTTFDQLPLREVPSNVSIKGSDGAATGYWVGESKAIPASAPSASTVSLTPLKVAALAVLSNELIRDSSPSAELWVRDMLARASAQRVDATFLSATAASAGVSPAGLLNGLSAGTSAGADADAVRQDVASLMSGFIAARNVTGLYFVTTPSLALQLQLMRNALGQREFEGASLTGGTLEGLPMVVGDNVGAGDLILLKPSDIWKIGDTGLQISISREATIEQNSVPTGATDTPVGIATAFTSMFQEESTAIKVVRSINFAKRRTDAVAYIGDADYNAVTSV